MRNKLLTLLSDSKRFDKADVCTLVRISQELVDDRFLGYIYKFDGYDTLSIGGLFETMSWLMQNSRALGPNVVKSVLQHFIARLPPSTLHQYLPGIFLGLLRRSRTVTGRTLEIQRKCSSFVCSLYL
jgi:hypothetical protein